VRTDLTLPGLTTTDIARAALTGAVAGTVSAGLRWAVFRYEAARRTKRLESLMGEAVKSFSDAVSQARMGLEHGVRAGAPTPWNNDALSVTLTGPPKVSPEELTRIFEDLSRARRGRPGS
jgi:hypothetical protein